MKVYILKDQNLPYLTTLYTDCGIIEHGTFIPTNLIKIDEHDSRFVQVDLNDELVHGFIEAQENKSNAEEDSERLFRDIKADIVEALTPVSENIETHTKEKLCKASTGIKSLDDLLMGGIPHGSNVMVYGPSFMGKEVIANKFVVEGLMKGVPAVYVTTGTISNEIIEEMKFIFDIEGFAEKGLLRFVDEYSMAINSKLRDPNTYYIDFSSKNLEEIPKCIKKAYKSFSKNENISVNYQNTVFRSASAPLARLGIEDTLKLMKPIIDQTKKNKSIGMYLLDKGIDHPYKEVKELESLMDMVIELKVQNMNMFLSVQNGEAKSKDWFRYVPSKNDLDIRNIPTRF